MNRDNGFMTAWLLKAGQTGFPHLPRMVSVRSCNRLSLKDTVGQDGEKSLKGTEEHE